MLLDDIKSRLAVFGYVLTENDTWLIEFTTSKIENDIKNLCNVAVIPEELYQTKIDMIAGDFLFAKKNMGQITSIDLTTAVKSIQEGDTSITYAIGDGNFTPEQRFDAIINSLRNPCIDFAAFRRIKW